MSLDFTIIGAGATGTGMLYQLAQTLAEPSEGERLDPRGARVRVIERRDTFGPGFPHSDRNALPFHLINMCARDMSIEAGRPDDFQAWLNEHRDALGRRFPDYRPYLESPELRDGACTYVPRGVMGKYLEARFQKGVALLRASAVATELYAGWEAVEVREEPAAVRVTLRKTGGGSPLQVETDRVLLATGHWFEEPNDGRYFPSPWPPRALERRIPPGARIGVIGTSLSAVDAALTLTADGAFARDGTGKLVYEPGTRSRRLTLYSRSGQLPRVRGRSGDRRNRHFTRANVEGRRRANGGFLCLGDLFELLDADLRAAYGRPIPWEDLAAPPGPVEEVLERAVWEARRGDGPEGELIWQTVLHQTFPMARDLYLGLAPEERARFDRDYATLFFLFASPMPPLNAEKLLALLRAGVVRVVRLGRDYAFTREADGSGFAFTYKDAAGRRRKEACEYVVDARGQRRSYETNPTPLARNLLTTGTVAIEAVPLKAGDGASGVYRTGGLWVDPGTQRVVRAGPDGAPEISKRIYAVGVPTRGQILDASMAHSCAVATGGIARALLREMRGQKP